MALEEADVPRRRLVEQDARKLSFPGGILFHMRAFMRDNARATRKSSILRSSAAAARLVGVER